MMGDKLRDKIPALLDEFLLSGYSLSEEDVAGVLLSALSLLVGWGQHKSHQGLDTLIGTDEWVIMEPVVRSHCDLIQARRMEGTQSLGMTNFGLSVSEATSNYHQALDTFKREAFCEEPFSVM